MSAQLVVFHCTLKNRLGQTLSQTLNSRVLTAGELPEGQLSLLYKALQGLKCGEKCQVALSADQAFGFYDPALVIVRDLKKLGNASDLKLGELVKYQFNGKLHEFRIIEINAKSVTLDGNHPFAGQDLIFDLELKDIKAINDSSNTVVDYVGPYGVVH